CFTEVNAARDAGVPVGNSDAHPFTFEKFHAVGDPVVEHHSFDAYNPLRRRFFLQYETLLKHNAVGAFEKAVVVEAGNDIFLKIGKGNAGELLVALDYFQLQGVFTGIAARTLCNFSIPFSGKVLADDSIGEEKRGNDEDRKLYDRK